MTAARRLPRPDARRRARLDVGVDGPRTSDAHRRAAPDRAAGRGAAAGYVALTRAKHQCVIWWAGSYDATDSPLGRLLFARTTTATSPRSVRRVTPTAPARAARLAELAAPARPACDRARGSRGSGPPRWLGSRPPPRPASSPRLRRGIDWTWRRTSFSDITAGSYEATVASEPEEAHARRTSPTRPRHPPPRPGEDESGAAACRSRSGRCRSASASERWSTGCSSARTSRRPTSGGEDCSSGRRRRRSPRRRGRPTRRSLAAPLSAAIETPLGRSSAVCALRDLAPGDRLDELDFELPLVGGDGRRAPELDAIATVLRRLRRTTRSRPTPGG